MVAKIEVVCAQCGNTFLLVPWQVRSGRKYCSVQCDHLSRKGKKFSTRDFHGANNPKWRGGKIKMSAGRVAVYCPDHPDANLMGGTHILEYRLIAEKKIGRRLRKDEVVHHINGDATDNRPSNLEVITFSKHAVLHNGDRDRNPLTGRYLPNQIKKENNL